MTEKVKNNIRKYFGWFTGVWTCIVAVALIVQVWRIYGLQDGAFTVEKISARFNEISALVYIWLATVLTSGILSYVIPAPQCKITPYVELSFTLARLQKRLPNTSAQREKQAKKRIIAYLVCAVFAVICVVVALVYMLANYETQATSGFLAHHQEAERILRALVWVIAGLGVSIGTAYFTDKTYKKEISFAKAEITANAKQGVKYTQAEEKTSIKSVLKKAFAFTGNKWFVFGVRVAVLVLAVIFIFVGMENGGVQSVLEKAINICTQCIGIG